MALRRGQNSEKSDTLGVHALLLRLSDMVCLRWLDASFQRTLGYNHFVESSQPLRSPPQRYILPTIYI